MLAVLPQGFWLIAGGMAVLAAITVLQRAKIRRREAGGDFVRDGEEEKRAARESMEALFVQLQEFSRETVAKLDTKVKMLNELLSRAEARIEELKRLSAPAPPAARSGNPLHEKVFHLSDEGRGAADIAGVLGLERGEVEMILGLRKAGA